MASHLNTIRINDSFYEHYIDTNTNATYLCERRGDGKLFVVESGGIVLDKDNNEIGKWNMDDNHLWYYVSADGSFRLDTGNKNLIKAEAKLFKKLMGDDREDWRLDDSYNRMGR